MNYIEQLRGLAAHEQQTGSGVSPEIERGAQALPERHAAASTKRCCEPVTYTPAELTTARARKMTAGVPSSMPRRLVLTNYQGMGDIICLTAAVRDLHLGHPGQFQTDVRVSCGQLWDYNPYITRFPEPWIEEEAARCRDLGKGAYEREGILFIPCTYAITEHHHFSSDFHRTLGDALGIAVASTALKGDIHIHPQEAAWMSQLQEMGVHQPFWLMATGGKFDYTAKWPNPYTLAKVAEWFFDKRTVVVQVGDNGTWHPAIPNTINLVGHTDLRMLVRLVYHSLGVICPVTGLMHMAAAVPIKPGGPAARPCVVLAGGREPTHWEAYPTHRYLTMQGALPCCTPHSCDKARCTAVGDGDPKDLPSSMCVHFKEYPAPKAPQTDRPMRTMRVAKCLDMISAADIVRAIETYYQGGVLSWPS